MKLLKFTAAAILMFDRQAIWHGNGNFRVAAGYVQLLENAMTQLSADMRGHRLGYSTGED